MSFTTTSPDNVITIGDTNDTIKLNKISPLYTSITTSDFEGNLSVIGGYKTASNSTSGYSFVFDTVPIGVYILCLSFYARSSVGGNGGTVYLTTTVDNTTDAFETFSYLGEGSANSDSQTGLTYVFTNTASRTIYAYITIANRAAIGLQWGKIVRIA